MTNNNRCQVCGGSPDGYVYECDEEQAGLPPTYLLCSTCMAVIVDHPDRKAKSLKKAHAPPPEERSQEA